MKLRIEYFARPHPNPLPRGEGDSFAGATGPGFDTLEIGGGESSATERRRSLALTWGASD
jgi:hypothetical protein